ncbi:MAG TPA: glycosyltransferase [Proteobacteria bacterium]|nr:glycosyltransferase [Pseudomonadota bacterium]
MKIIVTSIVDLKKSAHNSRLHQLLKHLSEKHEITVLSINDHWKAQSDDKSDEYYKDFQSLFERIEMLYLSDKIISPISQELLSFKTINGILKKLGYDFDVHFNYNTLISGYFVAKKMKKAKRLKTVYDIADDLPEMIRSSPQIPSYLRSVGGFVGGFALKKNLRLSDTVTYTTDALRFSCGIPINKSILVPNGVDTELFRPHPSDRLKAELGLQNSFVVGHVGVLREWLDFKPLFVAVKALNEKLDLKLLMVGGGVGYQATVDLARKCGLQNVVFTGTVPYTQVPKYISCMDVCVVPFKQDKVSQNSLPLKLFEYMACEKPVISTRVDGIVKSFKNHVLYVSNAEEYKNQILGLYDDEIPRKNLGLVGREFVKNEYNWSAITSKLELILKDTAG